MTIKRTFAFRFQLLWDISKKNHWILRYDAKVLKILILLLED